ncbi:MAG: hypothetical protein ACI9C1_000870 [Candidatus Aldehydirespiratoraceae bacterium]|jgi:hypothetical protein
MTRYLIGIVLFVGAFVPLGIGIRSLRRALLPPWRGSVAWLADAVLLIASILLVTQCLGILGIYRLTTAVVSYALLGLALRRLSPRLSGRFVVELAPAPPSLFGRTGNLVGVIAVAGWFGPWFVRVAAGLTGGVGGADTLWYHLPTAAKLTQTGSLREIEVFDAGNLTAFFPNIATFFHATGMLFLESDIASPFINFGWAALALLAGWAIGRPLGLSPITLLATAASLSFPGYIGHQAGSAMSDLPAFSLVLVALALLINARPDRLTTSLPVIAMAAVATGAALGAKWTAVPSAGAVTVAVLVIAQKGYRLRSGATWLVASAAAGLFTYVRNFVIVGNPLPPQELSFGPVSFDAVRTSDGTDTVASWLTDDAAWNQVFRPGLELWFGPLWAVVLVISFGALVLAMIHSAGRLYRIAAFVGIVTLVGYLFSPQNLVFFGLPQYFVSNARYGALAVAVGLVLLPTLPVLGGRAKWLPPVALLGIMASTLLTPRTWSGVEDWRFQDNVGSDDTVIGLIAAAVVLAAGFTYVLRPNQTPLFRPLALGLGALTLLVAVIGFPAYNDARYAKGPVWSPAVDLTDARIGVVGVNAQFHYYGDDLSNYVQWIGFIDNGVATAATTCDEWAHLVNAGNYSHIVSIADPPDTPGPYAWTKADPSSIVMQDVSGTVNVFSGEGDGVIVAVFELTDSLDPSRCA